MTIVCFSDEALLERSWPELGLGDQPMPQGVLA
jgi:hypothetical protein